MYINLIVLHHLCKRLINGIGGEIKVEILKVSTKSNPNSVAGALAAIIKEQS